MADDKSARESFTEIASGAVQEFETNYFAKGTVQQTYLSRTKVLQSILSIKHESDMKVLDCSRLTVNEIVNNIVRPIWPSIIRSEHCKCKRESFKIGFLESNEFDFKKNIFELKRFQNCDVCLEEKTIINDLNNVIFIQLNKSEPIDFENVPKVILVEHEIFTLIALVHQIPSSNSTRHSISEIKRGRFWYTFDNNLKLISKSKAKMISPILLTYIRPSNEETRLILMDIPDDVNILENFHEFNDEGKRFKLINVCGPDSIFHSLICLFIDASYLFDSLDKGNNLLLLLSAFAKKDMNTVYKYRLDILKKSFKPKKVGDVFQVDCNSNIYNCVQNIFTDTFPSSMFSCNCGERSLVPIIDLNYKELLKSGIEKLQSCFFETRRTCAKCKIRMTKIEYGSILFIDVQPIDIGTSIITKLCSIPNEIVLANSRFRLRNVIDYCKGKGINGHYRAHCLRNDNTWYCFDDIINTASVSRRNRLVCPHMLIYAQIE